MTTIQHHASKEALRPQLICGYEGRMTEFDAYTVAFQTIPAGTGGAELYRGLPEDACQCEHWGYVFSGLIKFSYVDGHEEVVRSGEAYYVRPGHVCEALEDSETIEFSPSDEFRRTRDRIGRNIGYIPQRVAAAADRQRRAACDLPSAVRHTQ